MPLVYIAKTEMFIHFVYYDGNWKHMYKHGSMLIYYLITSKTVFRFTEQYNCYIICENIYVRLVKLHHSSHT